MYVCVCVCVCLIVCDVGTLAVRLPRPELGCCATDHSCAEYREIFQIDQRFINSPTDALVSCRKNDTKIYIKTAPTCFGVTVTPQNVGAVLM